MSGGFGSENLPLSVTEPNRGGYGGSGSTMEVLRVLLAGDVGKREEEGFINIF